MKTKTAPKQLPKIKSFQKYELKPEDLRWECDPNIFEFDSTESLKPIEGILGQERALKAIRLGVDLHSPGYNIYIAGLSGTGKMTTVKQMLESISSNTANLNDYAYVNNFTDPDRPILLTFKVGKAKAFKEDLSSAINLLQRQIPQALESESYVSRKQQIISTYNEKEQELLNSFDERLKKENFTLGQIKVGEGVRPEIFPVIDNQPISVYQLDELIQNKKLTKEEAQEILKKYAGKQEELQDVFKKGLKLSQEFQKQLEKLEQEFSSNIVTGVIGNLEEKYSDSKTRNYLNDVKNSILENLQIFKGAKPEGVTTPEGFTIDYFKEYEVNIILDNSGTENCPVIIETSPTYINLFGTIEKSTDGRGGYYTDFTKIKAGSILRACGGYLVLNVTHLFEEPGVWKNLKRVLTYRKLEIQDNPNFFQFVPTSLKPEPIDVDTKIILVGSQLIYSILAQHEYDFKKIFKVKADFDYEIKRSDKVITEYARVLKKLIKEENLCDFDKTALSELIEISARFAGHKNKLTTRFSKIADLAREANFWALDDGFNVVSAAHVQKAYAFALERHGMLETKLTDMIEEKMILLDTDGERVGQINGLAIYSADFYSFARPTRITATVSLGSGSIINVEREAGMSGRHYNKGVLIISGYFRETFGQDLPLSFNANLVFEQSYGTVDGDSASCAEIFALLSTLSGLPIKQSIAVTGSLNQKGDVQPIGGVNEKIEGFFDVCKANGLTGKQGVIIPTQNIQELMLRNDIIEAVTKGQFHIYAISRVEEGIEILTGRKAGNKTIKGYEPGSVFDLVEKKIKDLYAKSKAVKPANETQLIKKREKDKHEQKARRNIRKNKNP
ncbi:MAG: AAA family ATPase [Ignavibacteriaceae bacterium]|nr:AAA family ATPase [Ignavibacteriaceae bacterium]